MKKTILIIVALLIVAGAVVILPFYFAFFGNPIDCITTPNKIVKIVEERYDEDFKVIDKKCQYSVDYQEANVTLQSTKNPDIQFSAYTYDVAVATKDTVNDDYVEALWGEQFNTELKTFLDDSLQMPKGSYTMENYVDAPKFGGLDKNGDMLPYGDESVIFIPNITFTKNYEEMDIENMKKIIFFIQERVKHSTIRFKFKYDNFFLCGANSKDLFDEGIDFNSFCKFNQH